MVSYLRFLGKIFTKEKYFKQFLYKGEFSESFLITMGFNFFLMIFHFEAGSYLIMAGLEVSMSNRLNFKLRETIPSSFEIEGLCYHVCILAIGILMLSFVFR